MIKDGKKIVEVARHFNLNESTLRYIRKEEKKIRATASITFNEESKRVVASRDKFIVKTESVLAFWINDCRKKNIPLDSIVIREKAALSASFGGRTSSRILIYDVRGFHGEQELVLKK